MDTKRSSEELINEMSEPNRSVDFGEGGNFDGFVQMKKVPSLQNLRVNDSRFDYYRQKVLQQVENSNNQEVESTLHLQSEYNDMDERKTENFKELPRQTQPNEDVKRLRRSIPAGFPQFNNPFEARKTSMQVFPPQSQPQQIKISESGYGVQPQMNMYQGYPMDPRYSQMGIASQSMPQTDNMQLMMQKYEIVLRSLNQEFMNSLEQNRILQKEIMILQDNSIKEKRNIEDLKKQLEIKEGSSNSQVLINEKNEIKMENEALAKELLDFKIKNDTLQTESNDLKHHVDTLKNVNEKFRENELYLQKKFEEMRQNCNAKDVALRQRDEIIFQLTRNIDALKSDISNLEHIEDSLKSEIHELNDKRKSLEETNQQLKSQICDQGIELRKLDSANASLAREILTLKSSCEMLSKNNDELSQDNINLRDLVDKIENQHSSNIITIHQTEQENMMLKAENERLQKNKLMYEQKNKLSTVILFD